MADRRAPRSLWFVAVTLLLTACSTGVPPSGKVVVVSPVPPAPQPEQATGPGSGPRPGLSEAQVAQGFMRAMSTGDPERAAPWVVPDRSTQLQLQEWRSGRAVNVYTNEFQPQAPSDDHGQKLIEVRVQRSGMLTDRRWVPDSRQITLQLRLRQVEGEWRVANPDSAPWIDDASFEQTYGPVDLFMVAPDHVHLAQMRVFLARPPSARQQPMALQARAEATVRALLAGPEGRVARTLTTAIPSETRLLHFSYADSLATIDLSREFSSGVGDSGLLRVGQLVWTVTRLIPTASVRITVEGRPAVAIGPDDFNASGTWRWSAPQLSPLFSSLWPHGPGDPKRLAFTRNGELFTTELLPGARPTLLPYNTTGQKLAPTWASQGNRLAFLLVGEGGDGQSLWIGSGDGRTVQPTGIRGQLSPPTWLPDASRLLVLRRIGTRVELLSVTPGVRGAQRLQLARMPGGLQPTVLRISPDGAFVLAVGSSSRAKFGDSGVLFLGLLAPQGVVDWFPRPTAAGLGDVYSPIWVDSSTVAFIGRTGTKDDLGKLWLMDADGWDPTPLLNLDPASENAIDIGDQLTVDPTGNQFVFIEQSEEGTSLWVVDRLGVGLRPLTSPGVNSFDSDPSFATR